MADQSAQIAQLVALLLAAVRSHGAVINDNAVASTNEAAKLA